LWIKKIAPALWDRCNRTKTKWSRWNNQYKYKKI